MKDEDDVQDAADRAVDLSHKPSRFAGMKYEDGLRDALEWVMDDADEVEDPTK